jgi:hypothetical protein
MDEWRTRIRCYASPAGNDRIADWYRGLLPQERSDADTFIRNMRRTREWKMPDYRPRLRDGDGLGELRWDSCGRRHRLLGFFKDGYWFAVMGCTHKQQVYNPADALETAKKNKRAIERGQVDTVDYDI